MVRPDAYKLNIACIEQKRAGTLNPSKNISADLSLLVNGFSGASVNKT